MTPQVELCTDYGYPLLKITTLDGAIDWYYPRIPEAFHPIVPELVHGVPTVHIKDGFRISVFVIDDNPVPVILKISEI